jgi:hypothetical protein
MNIDFTFLCDLNVDLTSDASLFVNAVQVNCAPLAHNGQIGAGNLFCLKVSEQRTLIFQLLQVNQFKVDICIHETQPNEDGFLHDNGE